MDLRTLEAVAISLDWVLYLGEEATGFPRVYRNDRLKYLQQVVPILGDQLLDDLAADGDHPGQRPAKMLINALRDSRWSDAWECLDLMGVLQGAPPIPEDERGEHVAYVDRADFN